MITQRDYAIHAGLTAGRVSQLVKKGMPLTSKEAADAWRGMSAKGKVMNLPAPESPGPYRPPDADGQPAHASVAEDSPHGAYERQRQIERAAYALAVRSLKAGQPDAGRLVSIHAQAARNLTQAQQEVLDLAEREKKLVSGDWVRKVMTDHDGAVAQLLRTMPKQLSGRIAPHDPEHCERELDRWVQEVALATLHSTNPWK
jgi:hypothetical protein